VDWARHLDHQPPYPDNAAIDLDTVELANLVGQRFHACAPNYLNLSGL
jgi:hypothetical protein